jgi:hypothetical protein
MAYISKSITLKHLLIREGKQIGIQFNSDKVLHAIVKQLPGLKWSETYGMFYIPNTKDNLTGIFDKFRVRYTNILYRVIETSFTLFKLQSEPKFRLLCLGKKQRLWNRK